MVPRFWIWIEPTSRAAAFSASKARGRRRGDDRGPGRGGADAEFIRRLGDGSEFGDGREIDDIVRQWAADMGGENIGAAGEHKRIPRRQGIDGAA